MCISSLSTLLRSSNVLATRADSARRSQNSTLTRFGGFNLITNRINRRVPFRVLIISRLNIRTRLSATITRFTSVLPYLIRSSSIGGKDLGRRIPNGLIVRIYHRFRPIIPWPSLRSYIRFTDNLPKRIFVDGEREELSSNLGNSRKMIHSMRLQMKTQNKSV